MSDLSASGDLSYYEGRRVARSRIEIPGAAGGLRDALDVEPVELHIGDSVYVLMQVECVAVRHDSIKDSDELARVHKLKPIEGKSTFVTETVAEKMIEEESDRIRVLREEATGVFRLGVVPGDTEDDDEFGHEASTDVGPEPGDDGDDLPEWAPAAK